MSLSTGLYRIVDVDSEKDVALSHGHDRFNVAVHDDDDEDNENLWNIIALNTNEPIKYHIQSLSTGYYVEFGGTGHVHGTMSRGDRSIWYIIHQRNGQYMIASSPFGEFYWDLPRHDSRPVPPTDLDETPEGNKEVILARPGHASHRSLWRLISPSLPGISAAPSGVLSSTSAATACHAPHRRPGVSTRRLELVPRNQVDTLPFGIRQMRDGVIPDSRHAEYRNATDQLWIIATLRNALCALPPVFRYQSRDWNIWPAISPYFPENLRRTPTFVHIMSGLIDLATMIPGPATIDFTRDPMISMEVTESRVRVNTADWSDGTRCIAMLTFMILRALPEHY